MPDRALYSIQEARKLLGGISRNTIYHLLRTGRPAPVPIGSRRFISAGAIADRIALSTTTVSPWRAATRRKQPTRQSGVKGRRAVANSCKVFHRSSSVQRASVRLFETRDDRPVALQVIPYLYERCLRDLLRRRIAKVFAEPSEGFKSMRVYTKSFRSSGVKLPRNLSILFPSTALTYLWRAGRQ